jgi:hypothetical protein
MPSLSSLIAMLLVANRRGTPASQEERNEARRRHRRDHERHADRTAQGLGVIGCAPGDQRDSGDHRDHSRHLGPAHALAQHPHSEHQQQQQARCKQRHHDHEGRLREGHHLEREPQTSDEEAEHPAALL